MKIDVDSLTINHKWLEIIRTIGQLAENSALKAYVVGGVVRDLVLVRENNDIDIMVVGDALEFAEKVADVLHIQPLVKYERFGTAMLPHPELTIEIASARKEVYQSDSRKPEVVFTDLNEDLKRRDFTINAMAIDITPAGWGEFYDPFGGIQDLKIKLLRTPMEPEKTFFDDPLRMMRAVRFAAQLNFRIDDNASVAIQHNADRLHIISMERIRDELMKILLCPKPSVGLILMENTGLMQQVLPDFSNLKGVEERDGYAHKDVFYHTVQVIDNVAAHSDNEIIRLAAMFHDIGKPSTKRFKRKTGWTYHGHEDVGAQMFEHIGRHLKLPAKHIKAVTKLIRMHLRPIAITRDDVTDSAVRRLMVDAGDQIDALLTLCRADITSKNPEKVRKFTENFNYVANRITEVGEKDKMREFQSPFSGNEIMGFFKLKPGPGVGVIKSQIENAILEGIIENDFEAAKAWVEENRELLLKSLE